MAENAVVSEKVEQSKKRLGSFGDVEAITSMDSCRVVEPARFYASLRSEIATGPTGPRARLGTRQADLRRSPKATCL